MENEYDIPANKDKKYFVIKCYKRDSDLGKLTGFNLASEWDVEWYNTKYFYGTEAQCHQWIAEHHVKKGIRWNETENKFEWIEHEH